MPHSSAWRAGTGVASSASALARASPTRRGSDQVPPESGTRPIFEKAWMNLALSPARTMSQASAMLAPAPAATPLTAQTIGFGSAFSRRSSGL